MTTRKWLGVLAKGAVSAVLLWVALRLVDLSQVGAILARADPRWVAAAFGFLAVNVVLESAQFAAVVRAFGHRVRLRASIAITVSGRFFAVLSPGLLGSDVYRVAALSAQGIALRPATHLVLVSRLISLIALSFVMFLGLPLGLAHAPSLNDALILSALPIAALAGFAVLLWQRQGRDAAGSNEVGPWRKLPLAVMRDLRGLMGRGWRLTEIWPAALAQHLVRVGVVACLAKALDLAVPLVDIFAFVPVSLLAAMVPVTIGAWGLRELAFVFTFGLAGHEPDAALSLSVAFALAGMAVGLAGGLFWTVAPRRVYALPPTQKDAP